MDTNYINDPLQKAIVIRNHVYEHIHTWGPVPTGYPIVPFERLYENYVYSYNNPNSGHICGGTVIIFQSICEAFEIPTRYVGLFDDIDETYGSHATAEVFYNGQWIAIDPSLNFMPSYNGQYISHETLRQLAFEGKTGQVVWESNNYETPAGLNIQAYYDRFMLYYIAIQKSRVLYNGIKLIFDRKAFPESWDMTVNNGTYLLGTAGEDIYYHFSWGEYRFQDMELMTTEKIYINESSELTRN